ncbi:olfactory receptor 16 [Lynx pardinus]|uniref:Olfactory receptor 16 n=1 Tax=Lynx pardinus TaxID=191816 RepID=A0A485P7E6_LYNPA|nr:olfactory receptor 16 [Lynx pardinus]
MTDMWTLVWQMQRKNVTEVTEFIFLGFSIFGKHQITLFVVFLAIYILTLAGDIVIVTIIHVDHHLRTPVYFFLSMLASSEAAYTLVIVPRMLFSLILHNQPISSEGCATPMFFFVTLAVNSCFLLTAMGYDRYVAICNPLRYTVIMSKGTCAGLFLCDPGPVGLNFITYILLVSTSLKIPSAWGRKKAFATCTSHLTVVIVHYGSASVIYLKAKSEN